MNRNAKIREFKASYPHEQQEMIYQKLLEIEEKLSVDRVPEEVTNRLYKLGEVGEMLGRSYTWVMARLNEGVVQDRSEDGIRRLSWEDVQTLKQLKVKK